LKAIVAMPHSKIGGPVHIEVLLYLWSWSALPIRYLFGLLILPSECDGETISTSLEPSELYFCQSILVRELGSGQDHPSKCHD
jgi:hypothetical protein